MQFKMLTLVATLLATPALAGWVATSATGVQDVTEAMDRTVWVIKEDGAAWFSKDKGATFTRSGGSNFVRIAAGGSLSGPPIVVAVASDGVLWSLRTGAWVPTSIRNVSDVGVHVTGRLVLTAKASLTKMIWCAAGAAAPAATSCGSLPFDMTRIVAGQGGTYWSVAANGTLYSGAIGNNSAFQQWTPVPGGARDATMTFDNRVVLAANDGRVWRYVAAGANELVAGATNIASVGGWWVTYGADRSGKLWRLDP